MYPWNMESNTVIKSLSAMAHAGRLTLIRKLIQAGDTGIGSGDLAKQAEIGTTTASAQLLVLSNAGLVRSKRDGRRITYFANYEALGDLMAFLMHDCCANRKEICCVVERAAQ